jgi:hypothetical protein
MNPQSRNERSNKLGKKLATGWNDRFAEKETGRRNAVFDVFHGPGPTAAPSPCQATGVAFRVVEPGREISAPPTCSDFGVFWALGGVL